MLARVVNFLHFFFISQRAVRVTTVAVVATTTAANQMETNPVSARSPKRHVTRLLVEAASQAALFTDPEVHSCQLCLSTFYSLHVSAVTETCIN